MMPPLDSENVLFAWSKIYGELSTSIESWHPLSTLPWRFSPRAKSHELAQGSFASPASWSFTLRPKGDGRLRPFAHVPLDSQVYALACLAQNGSLVERDVSMADFSLGNRLANEILRIPAEEGSEEVEWAYLRQAAQTGRFYRRRGPMSSLITSPPGVAAGSRHHLGVGEKHLES